MYAVRLKHHSAPLILTIDGFLLQSNQHDYVRIDHIVGKYLSSPTAELQLKSAGYFGYVFGSTVIGLGTGRKLTRSKKKLLSNNRRGLL